MTEMWSKLAEPFPDSEVKQRPGSATWNHRDECQKNRCRETKDPAKHMQFSYIDARAVMQRLDDVLTPSGWDFTSSVIPGTDVVYGTLTVAGKVRGDYGYPNSDHDEEPIKAASSDALKRAAVMFGIGRHLYSDNSPGTGRAVPSPVRPAAPSRPVIVKDDGDPYADLPNEWEDRPNGKPTPLDEGQAHIDNTCPDHELPWTLRPGGISKTTGKSYDPFWACPSQDRPYCKNKPSKAWQARHEG